MALNKTVLEAALAQRFFNVFSNANTQSNITTVAQELAEAVADEVDAYIKQGTVIGTAPSSGGPITNGKVI